MSWTDDRVTLLRQLWGEGKTAAEIAKKLGEGVTRNAVIGKAHRLKLASRVSPIQQNSKKVAAKKAPDKLKSNTTVAPIVNRQQLIKKITEKKRTGPSISIEDLKDRMCRWPIGDPRMADFGFCGCKSEPNFPYCAEHAVVAYQSSRKSKKIKVEEFEETGNVKTASADDIKVA